LCQYGHDSIVDPLTVRLAEAHDQNPMVLIIAELREPLVRGD